MDSLRNATLNKFLAFRSMTCLLAAFLLLSSVEAYGQRTRASQTLTRHEAALLRAVCPTGLDALPVKLLPTEKQSAASPLHSPSHRWVAALESQQQALGRESITLTSHTQSPAQGAWLIEPETWLVPEDTSHAQATKSKLNKAELLQNYLSAKQAIEDRHTHSPPIHAISSNSTERLSQQTIRPVDKDPIEVSNTDLPRPHAPTGSPKVAAPVLSYHPDPLFQNKKNDSSSPHLRANVDLQRNQKTRIASAKPELILPPTATPQRKYASPHGAPGASAAEARAAAGGKTAYEAHAELYQKNCYPSARECAECHQRIYDDWSVSSHAYAFVSPMFHKFEQRLTEISQGTVGYFCYRCHSPVGTTMAPKLGYTRATPVGDLPEVAREGVTCIACHRVNERYAKTNGERRVVPGDISAPVYGGVGGDGVAQAIARRDELKLKLSPHDPKPGQTIHREGRFFDQLTKAEACTSCHQVAVHPGIKLEVVWEQYRASPACKKGVTCQDCHMGVVPGLPKGYSYGPIAEMSGKTVNNNRKQSSHLFHGPGYSIAHPGLFPQHKDASRWTYDQWLAFDWRAGWGTDEFEDMVAEAEELGQPLPYFPLAWADLDDRYDAREIIDDNLRRLERKQQSRLQVMENGSHVDGPFFKGTPTVGRPLRFEYVVANKNEGHNLPTASLGAQPQLWANVVLIGPNGRRLWETGYTDSKGDLCDIHSEDVRQGRAPFDSQLFNLQTMFLYTGATGTDREFPLPLNVSFDQVPHLRPGTIPITVTNHPPFIRMEGRSIAPLGKKRVKYKVPSELIREPGCYRLSFRLRSRTEPMYFMRFCNATPEMLRSMIEGTLDLHAYSVEFEVK